MENFNELYKYLENFLKLSGYSNRKFALLADIPPTTFQNMLTRKSRIRLDVFLSIYEAMVKITGQLSGTRNHGTLASSRTEFCNLYCKMEGLESKDLMDMITLSLGTIDISNEQSDDSSESRSRLLSAFYKMNETGQQAAAERVEELSQIPAYRKKED